VTVGSAGGGVDAVFCAALGAVVCAALGLGVGAA
jgi:hypothetical protein